MFQGAEAVPVIWASRFEPSRIGWIVALADQGRFKATNLFQNQSASAR